MGLLELLEGYLIQKKRGKEQVNLKEIFCKRTDDDFIQKFRTTVIGSEYRNPDGSARQDALARPRREKRFD